jgi:acyl-coenzyme A synthetase/AMP-(fatty) acid ligase
MPEYPLLQHGRPNATFARRAGAAITVEHFLHEAAALGRALPRHRYIVNLCRDRYRFAVGLAAALQREQITLLPPSATPLLLAQLAADHGDLYCLTDELPPDMSMPSFAYPDDLESSAGTADIPSIAADRPAVILFTSGSTGRPQPHPRSWGALVRSARAAGSRLAITEFGGGTLLGTVPHQHSYGLESLLMLALQHGLTLHAERLFYPADICAALALAPRPRLLVTTPIHLRVLLAETGELPKVDLVLSATAPLSPQLAREAEARFAAPLYEIYGCSEAGQLATRRTVASEEWCCLDGIVLRANGAGTIAAGAPIDVATRLNDLIELRDRERFLLHGRTADLVNIAGKRTSIAHLNYHLNAIAGVHDGVFVMPEGQDGNGGVIRLIAFAVAPALDADAIMTALRQRVDPAFLPRPLYLVDALPRDALGKLPREAANRLAAQAERL